MNFYSYFEISINIITSILILWKTRKWLHAKNFNSPIFLRKHCINIDFARSEKSLVKSYKMYEVPSIQWSCFERRMSVDHHHTEFQSSLLHWTTLRFCVCIHKVHLSSCVCYSKMQPHLFNVSAWHRLQQNV